MANTIIAHGITIEGELTSDDDVVIQGTLRGKLVSKDVVSVESGAVVEADISASSLSVGGSITGNVTASDRVESRGRRAPGGRCQSFALDDRRRGIVQGQRRHGRLSCCTTSRG